PMRSLVDARQTYPNQPMPLVNIGNSCYLNVFIQALFGLPQLMDTLQNAYDQLCSKNNSRYELHLSFRLTAALLELYRDYTKQGITSDDLSWSLRQFKNVISKDDQGKSTEFSDSTEKDSNELFQYV